MRTVSQSERNQWGKDFTSWKSTLGVNLQNVKVTAAPAQNSTVVKNKAQNSVSVQLIAHQLVGEQIAIDYANAEIQNLTFPFWNNESISVAIYPLLRSNMKVGYMIYAPLTNSDAVEAKIQNQDTTSTIYVVYKGELHSILVDTNGNPIATTIPSEAATAATPQASSACLGVCNGICQRYGVITSLAECASVCALTGAGEVICGPLCFAVLTFGCITGCNNLCKYV